MHDIHSPKFIEFYAMKSNFLKWAIIVPLLFFIYSSQAFALTIKIATLSPDGSFWMQKMREGGDEISKQTEGRVKFKFYPGGVMGKDNDVLRKIRLRQLHGAAITASSLSHVYPDIQIYNLLMKFHSLDEVDFVREKMDSELMAGLEENGFVPLGFAEIGMAYIMSIDPIQDIDQMRSHKAWVPENSEFALLALKSFSISPIPLPLRDVLMGLQTNMIDIVAGSPVAALALQWHTKVKYVTELPLSYIFGILAVDQKVFKKISKQDQLIVRSIMGSAIKEIDKKNRQDNLLGKDAMIKQGIQFVKPKDEAAEELRRTTIMTNKQLEKDGGLSIEAVTRMNTLLTDYRSTKQ